MSTRRGSHHNITEHQTRKNIPLSQGYPSNLQSILSSITHRKRSFYVVTEFSGSSSDQPSKSVFINTNYMCVDPQPGPSSVMSFINDAFNSFQVDEYYAQD